MGTWSVTTYDTNDDVLAYLRLGTYQSTEASLEPTQYPSGSDFASSDGIFLTTTGNLYLNADQNIDIEFKDDATLVIGDFAKQDTIALRIDATGSSGFASLRGNAVSLNAVTAAAEAKTADAQELVVYASGDITSVSQGDTQFHSADDVYIENSSASSSSGQSKTFTHGWSQSLAIAASVDITAGVSVFALAGLRTTLTVYSSETFIFSTGYSIMSNEIAWQSQENKGMGAYLKNIFGLVGAVLQEETFTEVTQKQLANGASVCGTSLTILKTKAPEVRSSVGVRSVM